MSVKVADELRRNVEEGLFIICFNILLPAFAWTV
jgi:hypothetical protein